MNYEEACEAVVSKSIVIRELKQHGFTFSEFSRDCGDFPEYRGQIVLDWLGY
tara:strand:+ start:4440 stop:4595 length:156 start_codon:yes stop_codon:yes gene_type:complete